MVYKEAFVLHELDRPVTICPGRLETVRAQEADIVSGLFRVDINEATPAGSVIPE